MSYDSPIWLEKKRDESASRVFLFNFFVFVVFAMALSLAATHKYHGQYVMAPAFSWTIVGLAIVGAVASIILSFFYLKRSR